MDLAKFETAGRGDAGEWMDLLHPETDEPLVDNDGKPARLLLVSMDSDTYQDALTEISGERFKGLKSRKQLRAAAQKPLTRDQQLQLMVKATKDAENIELDSVAVETPEQIADMYRRMPWILAQAQEFIGEIANFMKKPSTS